MHERSSRDEVLLLACDGLWDVFSNSEAIDAVKEIFESGETDPVKTAEEMVDLSLNKGSKDNVSAVVVNLPGAKFGDASGGGVEARRQQRMSAEAARAAPPQEGGASLDNAAANN